MNQLWAGDLVIVEHHHRRGEQARRRPIMVSLLDPEGNQKALVDRLVLPPTPRSPSPISSAWMFIARAFANSFDG
jgi:hypothetical protein